MTDTTRALLEQALNALTYKGHFPWADKEHFIDALRAELAKPRLDQAETNKRLQALADSEGTRAVEYLRRARKAESEIEQLRAELAKPTNADPECAESSVDYWQQRGYLGSPGEWREACRLFRVRCSPEDIQRIAKLRAYIEDGLLIVSRPDNKPPTPAPHDAPETIALQLELESAKEACLNACKLVADMHAAAVGEVTGPRLGVVEDVATLKAERDRYRKALEAMTRKEPCDCGCPSGEKVVILKPAHYYAIAAEALKGDAAITKAEGRKE